MKNVAVSGMIVWTLSEDRITLILVEEPLWRTHLVLSSY